MSQGNDVLPTAAGGGHKPSQGPTQTASLHVKQAPQKRPPQYQGSQLFLGLCVSLSSVRAPKSKEEVTHIRSDLVCHLPRRWGGELSPTNLLKDLGLNPLQLEIGLLPGTSAYSTRPDPLDHSPGTIQPLGQVICFRRLLLLGTLVKSLPFLQPLSSHQ